MEFETAQSSDEPVSARGIQNMQRAERLYDFTL